MMMLTLTISQKILSSLTAAEVILVIILIITFLFLVMWLLFEDTLLRLAGWVK